jgi:hypothetical protein
VSTDKRAKIKTEEMAKKFLILRPEKGIITANKKGKNIKMYMLSIKQPLPQNHIRTNHK